MNVVLFEHKDHPGSEKAYKFFRPENRSEVVHIAKNLVEHISRDKPDVEGWRRCTVDIPDWLALKEDL